MKKFVRPAILLGCLLLVPLTPVLAQAGDLIVGVNLVNAPYNLTDAEQENILQAMQKAGVRVIRVAAPGPKGIAFAEQVYAHGMKILLLGGVHYSGAWPPPPPQGFNGMWGLPALSHANPELLRNDFAPLMEQLEAKGIVLAGIEIGNELNWTGFNADFPLPGTGRVLQVHDLTNSNDPEGQQVAKGLLLYVKSLEIVKDVRDHSKLNQHTPIISAGMADLDNSAHKMTWIKADAVGADAALDFMRTHGLDDLVDAYGLHFYPIQRTRGDRLSHLKGNGLEQCQPPGHKGKPCWITEWGYNNTGINGTCPVVDKDRLALVREIRPQFGQLAKQGRLGGVFFYTWQGNIRAPIEDRASAFICGGLTPSGRLAIDPM